MRGQLGWIGIVAAAVACSPSGGASVAGTTGDDPPAPGVDAGADAPPSTEGGAPVEEERTSVTIDFDDAEVGDDLSTRYATYATFASNEGGTVRAKSSAATSSEPNFLCSGGCYQGIVVTFTKPVRDLRFHAVGVNEDGVIASVKVYTGQTLATTIPVEGLGSLDEFPLVDLSSVRDVTRIEVTDITDFGGIGFDDFTFTVAK